MSEPDQKNAPIPPVVKPRASLHTNDDAPTTKTTTLYLTLSLNILLLAFFIVLTASSNYEQVKSEPIMKSLEATFGRKFKSDRQHPAYVASEQEHPLTGETFEEVQGLFRAQGIPFNADKTPNASVMRVRVSADGLRQMFGIDSPTDLAKTSDQDFLQKFVMMLLPENTKSQMRLHIIGLTKKHPGELAETEPEKIQKLSNAMEKYIASLLEKGFPADHLSIGLERGTDGFIDLYFYPLSDQALSVHEIKNLGKQTVSPK